MAARRPKGTGSIYVRKDGRIIGQYEVETLEGKKRKYVSGKTKKEVAQKLTKAIADNERGLLTTPNATQLIGWGRVDAKRLNQLRTTLGRPLL
jgi:hypothetical protein